MQNNCNKIYFFKLREGFALKFCEAANLLPYCKSKINDGGKIISHQPKIDDGGLLFILHMG